MHQAIRHASFVARVGLVHLNAIISTLMAISRIWTSSLVVSWLGISPTITWLGRVMVSFHIYDPMIRISMDDNEVRLETSIDVLVNCVFVNYQVTYERWEIKTVSIYVSVHAQIYNDVILIDRILIIFILGLVLVFDVSEVFVHRVGTSDVRSISSNNMDCYYITILLVVMVI